MDAGRNDKTKCKKPQDEGTRGAFRAARGIRALMAAAFLAVGAYGLLDEYEGLWAVQSYGIPVALVGFWNALRFAFNGVGGLAAGRLSRFFTRIGKHGLSRALAASGLLLILSTLLRGPARFLPYLAYYFSMAAVSVILEGRMHRAVEDSGRATLLSLGSLGATLTSMVLSPLFGRAADTFGFRWMLILKGFAGIAAGVVSLFSFDEISVSNCGYSVKQNSIGGCNYR